jgi:RNA polymerase sigma factor (sigma-70 family)
MSDPLQQNRSRLTDALKENQDRLVGFARRRLPEQVAGQDAEDVLSDVVLRLLERADLLAEVENVTAYLFTALGHRVADLFRKKHEQPLPEAEPLALEDTEAQLGISQALDLLSTAERAVWLAVEMDGFSFRELAERWGEPIGTLLSRKARATKNLRRILGAEHGRPTETPAAKTAANAAT